MTKCGILTICFLLISAPFLYSLEDPIPDSLRNLARLEQDSNHARLKALQEILRERDIPYELQTFESRPSPHGRTQGVNLVITFGKGSQEITLGAHYDAYELNNGVLAGGMVDNGAGTIILVRVAEALKGRDLRHRIRIAFFDMEEVGMLGSKAFVAEHKSNIAAAINIDIAGFGDALGYGFGNAEGTARIRRALLMTCAEQLLTCIDVENLPPSDDRSFQDANIPVLSMGFMSRLMAAQLWLLLNGGANSGLEKGFVPQIRKIIHTPEDSIDKIDPATLDLGVQVVLNTVLKLDADLE